MPLRDSLPDQVILLRDGAYTTVPLDQVSYAELVRLADEMDAAYARFKPCSAHGDGKRCADLATRGDLRNCQPRPMWHWYRGHALRHLAGERRPLRVAP